MVEILTRHESELVGFDSDISNIEGLKKKLQGNLFLLCKYLDTWSYSILVVVIIKIVIL